MGVSPADVLQHDLRLVVQRVADLARREDHVDRLRQQLEELEGIVDGLGEVVVRLDSLAEHTAHRIDIGHLLRHKLHTCER